MQGKSSTEQGGAEQGKVNEGRATSSTVRAPSMQESDKCKRKWEGGWKPSQSASACPAPARPREGGCSGARVQDARRGA